MVDSFPSIFETERVSEWKEKSGWKSETTGSRNELH